MASYKQINSWREDGYGEVSVMFVIADTYAGLFMSSITEANIFELEDVENKLNDTVGGAIENSLNFSIDGAKVKTSTEIAAKNFVLDASAAANKRFCGVFVVAYNEGSGSWESPSSSNMMFAGIIQTEIESEEMSWSGTEYGTDILPVSNWSFNAKPYSSAAIGKYEVEELIEGLSDTWKTTNVVDRDAYFDWSAKNRKVKVQKLVSLNHVLRGLADVLETKLSADGYGAIDIAFDYSPLDGRWHPARWNKQTITKNSNTYYTRFVKHPEDDEGAYEVYADDYNTLAIDPDWSGSTISNVVYLSWGLFESIDGEPQYQSAKSLRLTRFKSFFELLEAIAFTFGCYVMYYWETTTELRIRFISRGSMASEQVYLKTAAPRPKKKISSTAMNEADQSKIKTNAFYFADEGQDAYTKIPKEITYDPVLDAQYAGYQESESKSDSVEDKVICSISPTVCMIAGRVEDDSSPLFTFGAIPHSHYFEYNGSANTKKYQFAYGMHNAIFLYVEKNTAHTYDNTHTPDYYYTPAAKLSLSFNGEIKQYDKITDYLNELNGYDLDHYKVEYSIDIPFYYAFSESSSGTSPDWKAIDIGKKITLDSVDYTVLEVKYNLSKPLVSIKMQGTTRFNIGDDTTGMTIIDPGNQSGSTKVLSPDKPGEIENKIANESITTGNIVALRTDGKIEIAKANQSHHNTYYGVMLEDVDADESGMVMIYGQYYNAGYSFTPGPLYIRNIFGEDFNLSQTILEWKNTSEDMVVKVANAIDANTITFDLRNQPRQLILEVEMT